MNFKQTTLQAWPSRFLSYGGFFSAVLLMTIYFSTSLAVIASVIVGLLWLLSGQFIGLPGLLKRYPVAAWSLLLYGCFIVGSSYGDVADKDAFAMLNKYRELFFIPVLIPFFTTERYRNWAWNGLIVASVVILLISYLMDFGVFALNGNGDACLKSRITHSLFIAFFAFFCAHRIFDDKRYAKLYLTLLILCLYNLFFVVEGRTGQLIAVALVLLFARQRLTAKWGLVTVLVTAIFLALFVNFSDKAERITEGVANTQAYLNPVPEQPEATESSMGQRYTFWKYSLKLMAEKPLLGHGTGSFAKEYQRIASGEDIITRNPHNEFFMIGVQLGLFGLLTYLCFLGSQYYYAKKLPTPEKWLAAGILTSLLITSVFNTPFLDHAEGHWFATLIALCFAALQNPPVDHVE